MDLSNNINSGHLDSKVPERLKTNYFPDTETKLPREVQI